MLVGIDGRHHSKLVLRLFISFIVSLGSFPADSIYHQKVVSVLNGGPPGILYELYVSMVISEVQQLT